MIDRAGFHYVVINYYKPRFATQPRTQLACILKIGFSILTKFGFIFVALKLFLLRNATKRNEVLEKALLKRESIGAPVSQIRCKEGEVKLNAYEIKLRSVIILSNIFNTLL